MDNLTEKPWMSPSQLSSYLRCGEAYRRRYVEKEVIPPAIAMVKGTAVHKGAEHNFKQKIQSRTDLKSNEVIEVAVSTFEERIKHEGVFLDQEEESRGKTIVLGEGKDSTARLARLFMDGGKDSPPIAPKYQPQAVEIEQKIILETSTHDLKGIVDLVTDKNEIVDLKTTGKTMAQDTADRSDQLTFYAMIHRARYGKDPSGLVIENLVDLKTPKIVTLDTTRTMDDYKALINRLNSVADAINKGIFIPTDPTNFFCSKRFCGYFSSCPYVSKNRK